MRSLLGGQDSGDIIQMSHLENACGVTSVVLGPAKDLQGLKIYIEDTQSFL